MAPQKKDIETIELNSLGPIISRVGKNRSNIYERINIIDLENQKRITLFHYVVHILAFSFILPYLILIICQIEIPREYSTIVSVVVGFYFAKSLFN